MSAACLPVLMMRRHLRLPACRLNGRNATPLGMRARAPFAACISRRRRAPTLSSFAAPAGRIFDVAVDLRPESPTFRRWTSVELSEDNRDTLAIPAGCAHGFMTLEDGCGVLYMMGGGYGA